MFRRRPLCYLHPMTNHLTVPDIDDDDAEREALEQAVAQARGNPASISHEVVREWLLRLAAGDFAAEPPTAGG